MPPNPEPRPFFVYGTLRPGESNHDRMLHGRIATCESARLPGALVFQGPEYPYATDGPAGHEVLGHLITPHRADYDAVLADLDRLEEYVPDDPASPYLRVAREVSLPDGDRRSAWVYLAGSALLAALPAGGRPVEGGDWRSDTRPR